MKPCVSAALFASLALAAYANFAAAAEAKKSIRNWVSCDGRSDDSAGAAKAFAAAAHGAFTLQVDCSLRLQIGIDISRPIFIDDDTSVEFTDGGSVTVDNVLIPAFVIAGSKNILLKNWNVVYDAALPVNPLVGGHNLDARFVAGREPSPSFSEERVTPWLAAHRGIRFDSRAGRVTSLWTGSTNMCAIFFVTGEASHVAVSGMRVGVPAGAGAERFIPVVISFNANFKSNQTVSTKTPITAEFVAVPHDVAFSNIAFDGTYMGWLGNVQGARLENIKSGRYADLQDARGENIGGMRKWFAPPHLIYFSRYAATQDPALANRDIWIRNVVDEGLRVGLARDGAKDAPSGNALSLKIGCTHCGVDQYSSNRPDGFLDLLSSDGIKISNVQATYDSAFLNGAYPGWRFPQAPYVNLIFENISLTDVAPSTLRLPIGNINQGIVQNLVMKNVQVHLNSWDAGGDPFPRIVGDPVAVGLEYTIKDGSFRIVKAQAGSIEIVLRAAPSVLAAGEATTLSWTTRQANTCAAEGAWSGNVSVNGSRSVSASGDAVFELTCQNDVGAASAKLRLTQSN